MWLWLRNVYLGLVMREQKLPRNAITHMNRLVLMVVDNLAHLFVSLDNFFNHQCVEAACQLHRMLVKCVVQLLRCLLPSFAQLL